MNQIDIDKLVRERETRFIESRVKIEQWITRLFKQIEGYDLSSCTGKPEGRTAQEIFPSLYTKEFNVEAYQQEYKVFMSWYSQVRAYADRVNKAAMEALGIK